MVGIGSLHCPLEARGNAAVPSRTAFPKVQKRNAECLLKSPGLATGGGSWETSLACRPKARHTNGGQIIGQTD